MKSTLLLRRSSLGLSRSSWISVLASRITPRIASSSSGRDSLSGASMSKDGNGSPCEIRNWSIRSVFLEIMVASSVILLGVGAIVPIFDRYPRSILQKDNCG